MSLKTTRKLTREEKLELLAAIEEKEKRDLLRRPKFQPHEGQVPVLKSRAQNRFVFSANGTGKTAMLVNAINAAATGIDPWTGENTPVPAKIIVVVDNSKKIDEVLLPEWRKWHYLPTEWCKRQGKPYTAVIEYDNGSTISFYSAEADPMTFEGVQATHVFVDEPIRRQLYVALRRSLRIKGKPGRLMFCGTAISEAWLRRDIWEPWSKGELPDVECFKVGIEVNRENLPEGYIESFGRALSEAEKEVRLKGGFFDSDALALGHLWRRDIHIVKDVKWDPRWPVVVGLDPHPVKKHVAVMVGATPDNRLIVLKELNLKATAAQFAVALKKWSEGYRVIDWVCDSLGSTEGTGNEGFSTFIEVVRKHGVPLRPTRYEDKSHEDLIDRLQSGLLIPETPDNYGKTIPKLRVAGSCTGVIADVESATWQKNRATQEYIPKLDTSQKDFLSALGYALSTNLYFKRAEAAPVYREKPLYGIPLPSQRKGSGWRSKVRGRR